MNYNLYIIQNHIIYYELMKANGHYRMASFQRLRSKKRCFLSKKCVGHWKKTHALEHASHLYVSYVLNYYILKYSINI